MAAMTGDPAASYRRAEHLVCYWQGTRLVAHNYATASRVAVDPVLLRILATAGRWATAKAIASRFPGIDRKTIQAALDALTECSLIVRRGARAGRRERALRGWKEWIPEAALFHLGIRDTAFTPPELADPALRAKVRAHPPPPALKKFPGAAAVTLPAASRTTELSRVLLRRRTWRRFGSGEVTAGQLATLLGLTWGVQQWMEAGGRSTRAALKTAPSGGARHSLEAYVLIRQVEGLHPGLYHYDPDGHRLVRLPGPRAVPDIADYVPHQIWYQPAAALVLMTAVFARAQWRYPYSRAYRSVLFEAGHHCQTFLLLATALGLAPFCTGALADSRIDADLGIDGVSEAVIYACGVGSRPRGVAWAPWPEAADTPKLFPPRSRRRRTVRDP